MNETIRWSVIVICLMLIWSSIILLFYLKADEVTKNPCSICAERMGKKVECYQVDYDLFQQPARITFYQNGSIANG